MPMVGKLRICYAFLLPNRLIFTSGGLFLSQPLHPLVQYYSDRVNDIVALTTTIANYETPTGEKARVNELGNCIEEILHSLGAEVERLPRDTVGDILLARWNTDAPGKPLMFLMHMDTVWPLGTLKDRPVHV